VKRFVYSLAFVHLSLIAVVIFHGLDELMLRGWWEQPLAVIRDVNYSLWKYGFFAPDVGASTEVEIRLTDDGGQVRRYSTLEGFRFFLSNLESANRFYGFKRETAIDENYQDLSARSVATRMLNLHPNAWRVEYTLRSIRYPTMRDYRNGARAKVGEIYDTTFVLR
jgi:hypothetical protein